MKRVALVILTIVMIISSVGCFGKEKNLYIELNGGSMEIAEGMSFEQIMQKKPVKDGYDFAGWYSDEGFTDYINPKRISDDQEELGMAYAKWIQVEPVTYDVRSNEATITDSGREKQIMDVVYLTHDYDLKDLQRAGYKTFRVVVSLDVAEENKGYQYVFLYRSDYCNAGTSSLLDFYDKYVFGENPDDPDHMFTYQYEHGGTDKCTAWGTTSFEAELPISDLKDNLYIRYGASGEGEDTWYNRNIVVMVIPQK